MRRGLIKLPGNLWHSPRVERLAELMRRPKTAAIGCLIRFWTQVETHGTERGSFLKFASPSTLDRLTRVKGFGSAMLQVEAIEAADGGLKIHWNNKPKTSVKNLPRA
jgi:hypothetical protein